MLGSLVLLTGGCAALFPATTTRTQSPWESFVEAEAAFERIRPNQTRIQQLKEMGFDPSTSPNVKILTYLDIIERFMPNQAITKEDLHPAVRGCIEAKEKSHAYELELADLRSKRHGNLLLDALGFRRRTHETGWQFKALILMNDGLVVYKLSSGQPMVSRFERRDKPLGPLEELEDVVKKGIDAAK